MIGGLASPDDWSRFYVEATASSTLHLVKTHLPPRDDQRAIYVVRDGRGAVVSYYHFNRTYHPAEAPTRHVATAWKSSRARAKKSIGSGAYAMSD
jgi:Sulfotransferase domain